MVVGLVIAALLLLSRLQLVSRRDSTCSNSPCFNRADNLLKLCTHLPIRWRKKLP